MQGFIGWYMVSSGLIENNDVSHFRLSIHLTLALFILCLIFWYLLEIYNIDKIYNNPKIFIIFYFDTNCFTNCFWCFFIRIRWRS